jgi:AraC-like DNA-binding protein
MDWFDKLIEKLNIRIMAADQMPSFITRKVVRGSYIFLSLEPGGGEAFEVACAGWEEFPPDHHIERDGFRFHALEFISGGNWVLETGQGRWMLGPGSIFSYGPEVRYSLTAKSSGVLSKYFVDFRGENTGELMRQAGLQAGVPSSLLQQRWVHDLLDQLIDSARLPAAARERITRLLAQLILERIREDVRMDEGLSAARMKYEQCRKYLYENYLGLHGVATVARVCGVTPVHLSRLFQRFGRETPKQALTRLKMNHAAERILRGNLTIKEAAGEVGFDDAYHFSRVFKKVFGQAPRYFARGRTPEHPWQRRDS